MGHGAPVSLATRYQVGRERRPRLVRVFVSQSDRLAFYSSRVRRCELAAQQVEVLSLQAAHVKDRFAGPTVRVPSASASPRKDR